MVTLAFAMKELTAVFQKIHGMDHDIQRPTKATFAVAKRKYKQIFQRLQGKPFWIWDFEEHKQEDVKTNGLVG